MIVIHVNIIHLLYDNIYLIKLFSGEKIPRAQYTKDEVISMILKYIK